MGVMISSPSHCKLSMKEFSVQTLREDERVLASSLRVSSEVIQASGSDGGDDDESRCCSSMQFAMRYRDRRSGSRVSLNMRWLGHVC